MFNNVVLYDWVPFFKELSLRISEIGEEKTTRNERLKEKAIFVFGYGHTINKYQEIDPFSFIYALAQRATINQKAETYTKVKEVFSIEAGLPTDWGFPTPPPNALSLFYNQGGYTNDKGEVVGNACLWDLFRDAVRFSDFRNEDFETALSIKRVGLIKLTQALFLVNPEKYLPIDNKILWLPVLNIELDDIKEQIDGQGAQIYKKVVTIYNEAFPECYPYEINLLSGLLSDDDQSMLKLTDSFCQISSKLEGSEGPDYFEDFIKANATWPGDAGNHLGSGGYDLKTVNRGDIILVRRGTRNLGGIGVIIENEFKTEGYHPDKSFRIIWLNKSTKKLDYGVGDWKGFSSKATENTYEKFYSQYSNTLDIIDKIIAKQSGVQPIKRNLLTMNNKIDHLNTILYGPPGTGKTYSTIANAIAISNETRVDEDKFLFPSDPHSKEGRAKIKQEYDRLVNEGYIVFTTFHQNMSYEDFIEGIKPKTLNNQVFYEIQNGIFKEICNKARFISGNFGSVIEKFKTDISEEDGKPPLTIIATGTSFDVKYRGTTVFYVQPHNSVKENAWYPVNIDNIRKAFETENYKGIYNPTYVREIVNYLKRLYGLEKANREADEVVENYILIIDEINRGNISQIFGELITLIEPDKREGKAEELNVILPYSKQSFSVPDNLYIIGTMNTADRSVEALDTALRRRFSFEFMSPDSELVPETVGTIPLRKYFKVINERISFLMDQDHQIGHSYFMGISNELGVKDVFKTKVLPLLKEYFYNDFGKIRLVLGDGFVKKQENYRPDFAVTDIMELSRDVFKIVDIEETFDISAALANTLAKE